MLRKRHAFMESSTTHRRESDGRSTAESAPERARALMVLGTASHVGKSLVAAALCRIFSDDGRRVAPFKAQNMSLNSAATPDGGEIGRAQALQAECARVPASVDMNPVLLKPSSETGSQVVVLGKIAGESDARTYHAERVRTLFPTVVAAYERLAADYDTIVLEGAGSPAEINLRAGDIVNLRMAEAADAACVLVADIDRGGMFAALVGTLELLEPDERARIRGFIVNKFRGDRSLLQPGIEQIEVRLGIPCMGVIPFVAQLDLDEEDSVVLRQVPIEREKVDPLRIVVIALPHLANFTDFDALASEPSVDLQYAFEASDLGAADVVILPGTKRTIDDLDWLHARGFAQTLAPHLARGLVLGICGGMQMLGRTIDDPHGVEGGGARAGFGALPIVTTLATTKTTRAVRGRFCAELLFGCVPESRAVDGYEIHVGTTTYDADASALIVHDAGMDGASARVGSVLGTYLHGCLDDDAFRHAFLRAARTARRRAPAGEWSWWRREREARIDRWAAHVGTHCDLAALRTLLGS